MSLEQLVEHLGERADRTGFLKKISVAALGGTAAFLGVGVGEAEAAVPYLCCNLCHYPSNPNNCDYHCAWCWVCCHSTNGFKYLCCEGHELNQSCCTNGGSCCSDVLCSWVIGQGKCFG